MIEDELRELLADRASTVADNPDRLREVRSRVAGIRRRRTAGIALALVLLAFAGLGLTRLPGKPTTLPATPPAEAPPGPYFAEDGSSLHVPGYNGRSFLRFSGHALWSFAVTSAELPHVVVARCDRRGDLTLRGWAAADRRLSCRVPVGDHYEGALPLPAGATQSTADVELRPGSGGSWMVGVLEPLFPDRITPDDVRGALLTGFGSPAGGRMTVTVPGTVDSATAMVVVAVCVRGVRLSLSVAGRPLTGISCDDVHVSAPGLVLAQVTAQTARTLGLHGLQRVAIDVRSVGRQTDQWAITQVG